MATAPTSFFDLPAEIRLHVYDRLFTPRVVFMEAGTQEENPSLLPAKAVVRSSYACSGQILRVCKLIRQEAEPILYARTSFYVTTQAFAGKLPYTLANSTLFAPKVKHLTWQMHCDLMKHFYPEDFVMSSHGLAQLDSLELRCQAENWRDSFCGEWVDRQTFVRGRDQMIAYAQKLQLLMNEDCVVRADLVENRSNLSRGRVVLRLSRNRRILSTDEMLVA